MILPTSYLASLLLLVLSALCLGSWTSTYKATGKWRFELYYFDFAVGAVVFATIAAFTFGSLGTSLTFSDNMLITGKRQIGMGLIAGAVFNLGNLLLVAATSLTGMAIAFPVALGMGVILTVIISLASRGPVSMTFGIIGAVLIVATIVFASSALGASLRAQKRRPTIKGILVAAIGGIVLGLFPLALSGAMTPEFIGLSPYSAVFFVAIGMLLSTPVFNVYFMNLPIEGEPVEFARYFKGTIRQHLLGILGGMTCAAGLLAALVSAANVGPSKLEWPLPFVVSQTAVLVALIWALLYWRESSAASGAANRPLALMTATFVAGVALIAYGPK